MKYRIGIDVGGMSIKFGLVNNNGEIVLATRVVTSKDVYRSIDDMVACVNELLIKSNITINDVDGVGIGCPGAVDSAKGEVITLPNLGWNNIPLAKLLEERLNVKVVLSNDVNVAALGEARYGAAKKYNTSIMLAIGTGVGSGIIIDKKLFEGGFSRGAEIGHTTLYKDGLECTCGRKGCVECYASTTALIRQTKEEMLKNRSSKMWEFVSGDVNSVDGRTAFECSKIGDASAVKVVDTFVSYLGECLLDVCNVFRPDAIIIGGGISAQGDYFIDKLINYCEKFSYGYKDAPKTDIVAAILGNDAGIIGASLLLDNL